MKHLNLVLATAAVCATFSLAAGDHPKTTSIGSTHRATRLPAMQRWHDGDETPQSVVKLNVSQLGLRNISFQYEYAFHKNLSGAMGMSFFLKRPSPGFLPRKTPPAKAFATRRSKDSR